MDKDSKIYVAGHTGLVGSAIVRKLQSEGYSNLILKTRQEFNLLDQQAVYAFYDETRPDYVINSAARVGGIKANITSPADFLFDNLQIQNNIIRGAHLHGVKKLLFLGSSCIYPRASQQPIKEEYFMTGPLEPTNEGYAIAKIAGMKLCEKIFDQYDKPFISCMPTNIYGPGDNFDPESSHVIPGLMRRMHEAKQNNAPSISIRGSGKSQREFLYVDDLADAVVWLMNHYYEREFLNVGTGVDISIYDLAYQIKDIVGYEGELIFDTSKPDGMPRKLLDVSELTDLGWKTQTGFTAGLQQTYEYFKSLIV